MDTALEPTFEEDIKNVLAEVPPQVRTVFASGKVEIVAKNLMLKNRLHIDQGAILEREIILLLLGLHSPDEFTRTLIDEANINQIIVNDISRDINEQIFIPVQQQMRQGASAAPTSPMTATKGTARANPVRNPISNGANAPVPSYQRTPTPQMMATKGIAPVQQPARVIPPTRPIDVPVPRYQPPSPPTPQHASQSPLRDALREVTARPIREGQTFTTSSPIPSPPDHMLPLGERDAPVHVAAPLPPKIAMPRPTPTTASGATVRPSPMNIAELMRPEQPARPTPAPQQYVRTFAGDMETVERGGMPDLAPLEKGQPSTTPPITPTISPSAPAPSSIPVPVNLPPTSPLRPRPAPVINPVVPGTGDPYREPIE